jgi:hypothetical protein
MQVHRLTSQYLGKLSFDYQKEVKICFVNWNLEAVKVRYECKSTSYNSLTLAICSSADSDKFETIWKRSLKKKRPLLTFSLHALLFN